jgi:hypothetical protein
LPPEAKLDVRFVGEGSSLYWAEYVAIASGVATIVAAMPVAMQLLAEALGPLESFMLRLTTSLSLTRDWLKSAAWRLTPADPTRGDSRRPGCFGLKDHLDRRYKRCRDCGFLTECTSIVEAS